MLLQLIFCIALPADLSPMNVGKTAMEFKSQIGIGITALGIIEGVREFYNHVMHNIHDKVVGIKYGPAASEKLLTNFTKNGAIGIVRKDIPAVNTEISTVVVPSNTTTTSTNIKLLDDRIEEPSTIGSELVETIEKPIKIVETESEDTEGTKNASLGSESLNRDNMTPKNKIYKEIPRRIVDTKDSSSSQSREDHDEYHKDSRSLSLGDSLNEKVDSILKTDAVDPEFNQPSFNSLRPYTDNEIPYPSLPLNTKRHDDF